MAEGHGRQCCLWGDHAWPPLIAARNSILFLDSLYGQIHPSYMRHPKAISGSGVSAETYHQPRTDALDARKEAKDSYVFVDSARRRETPVAPVATAGIWLDNVTVQRKRFHCPKCNSGYTRLADMKTHCQFQCGKEPRYQCPYCTKKAKFSSNMYVHVRRIHKDEKLQIIDLYKQLSRVRYWGHTNMLTRERRPWWRKRDHKRIPRTSRVIDDCRTR